MSTQPLVRSLALAAAVLALTGPVAARAADTKAAAADTSKTVEGEGQAAIVGGDEGAAKSKATKAALRDALERTMGTYVASTSESKDFQSVSERVMSSTEGYVKSYDVVEAKKDGDSYIVKVKAVVDKGHIDTDMQARHLTIAGLKFPRLAVLIAEQNVGQTAPSLSFGPQGGGQQAGTMFTTDERVVENQLINEWKADGFSFVDMDALAGKLKAANVVSNDPSKIDPRQWSNLTDADVVIMGTAIAKGQGDLSKAFGADDKGGISMKSCKALISLRVLNTDNGEILATDEAGKTTMNIEDTVCGHNALIAASKTIADTLRTKVLKEWNARLQGGSRVRLQITKVPSLSVLTAFKSTVKEMRGVQSVDQKSFAKGAADLDLKVEGGDAESLAADLDGKMIGKTKVTVTGQTSSTITVEFQ